jgi:hypothetical protein
MNLLPLLAPVAALYWPQGVESAPPLRRAGIERLAVAPDQADAWRKAGFSAIPVSTADLASRERVPAPGYEARADMASPTQSPWIVANGWRYLRRSGGLYLYDLPAGKAALAAAEAHVYGADAILKIDPADLEELGRMAAFLAELPSRELPGVADLAVVDDGSALTGEVMNLLARHNLLYRPTARPVPAFRINVRLGSKEHPKEEATDPAAFAQRIRRELGDEQRSLRVYGSAVVIGRLTGDADRARLHLLNYGGRVIEGLRIRLRGSYAPGEARVAGLGPVPLEEPVVSDGATEFSVPRMGTYAVIDLPAIR